MPRWPFRSRETPGELVQKAARDITRPGLTAGARTQVVPGDTSELYAAARRLQGENQTLRTALVQGLTWTDPTVPFGPGIPAPPAQIGPDGQPRQYEYPVSWNLPGGGQKLIPWRMLRDAADVDFVRALIEAKKAELTGLEWDVTIGKRALDNAVAEDPHTPRSELERRMRDQLAPQIAKACAFWQLPDPDNGYGWEQWLGVALEEMIVLDALAVYPSQTVGGLHALRILDGSTIKPLLDWRGMRPSAPNPAFQQILYGFPRGEYTADSAPDGQYAADSLIYRRMVVRSWTPYGYSPVERALPIISTLIARDDWIRAEYGSDKPDTMITPPDQSTVTVDNYALWEAALNARNSGNAKAKRDLALGIPGGKVDKLDHDAEKYKPDYDLYLLKRLSAHFDLTITELGFSESKGLGSAGFHEGQDDVNERRNLLPWARRLSGLLTDIQCRYLGIPPELEFVFLGLDDEDEAATDQVVDTRTRGGRMTLNEGRDRLGMARYDFPEADQPFVVAGREIVFLNGELARQAESQQQQRQLASQIQDASAGQDPNGYDPDTQDAPAGNAPASRPGAKAAKKAAPRKAVTKADDARGRG